MKTLIKTLYSVGDPSVAELTFHMFALQVGRSATAGNWMAARAHAEEWARWLSFDLRLPSHRVWKEFKRTLAARWFGSPERRVFRPPWLLEDVLDYVRQFEGRNVRVSSFPGGIACHAGSERLLAANFAEWPAKVEPLDRSILVEAFPESSTARSICFRRYSTAFAEEVVYEAGLGQAMAVFESEQGRHPMGRAQRLNGGEYSFSSVGDLGSGLGQLPGIVAQLQALVREHDQMFQMKCAGVCRMTGIEWTSIEGYYDPFETKPITIVDMDLPFDFVFMHD